jgi:tetratricopeptide (TPR) repeat protein
MSRSEKIVRLALVSALTALPVPRALAEAAALLPEYARAFYRGDYARAETLAAEALSRQPSDTQARIVLARLEATKGRFDAAYTRLREAVRLDPHNPDALYYLGVTAGALAQAEYARVLALAPDSARAHQLKAQSYEAQGRSIDAEAEYKAALEKDPDLVQALVALGDLARSDLAQSPERFAQAREYYSRALARAPRDYDALYGLGACDAYAGDHAQAISWLRRALVQAPDSAPAHLALGISLLETGQTEAAVAELEAATKLEPRMRQAYVHLARAYHLLGRSQDVERVIARAKELARQEQEADQALLKETPRP